MRSVNVGPAPISPSQMTITTPSSDYYFLSAEGASAIDALALEGSVTLLASLGLESTLFCKAEAKTEGISVLG